MSIKLTKIETGRYIVNNVETLSGESVSIRLVDRRKTTPRDFGWYIYCGESEISVNAYDRRTKAIDAVEAEIEAGKFTKFAPRMVIETMYPVEDEEIETAAEIDPENIEKKEEGESDPVSNPMDDGLGSNLPMAETLSTNELLRRYNELASKLGHAELKGWSRAKTKLVVRIADLEDEQRNVA